MSLETDQESLERIDFFELTAATATPATRVELAHFLNTELLGQDPDAIALADFSAGRAVIVSFGKPMTVSQVQAELRMLIVGE